MKVKIKKHEDGQLVDAEIISSLGVNLPSLTDGWRFNFRKHAKKHHYQTYVLTCRESSGIVEGCLVFEMKNEVEPYMAYIEIAPHNRTEKRRYLNVAECLIAYSCRLSFVHGNGPYKGWMAFDVMEEEKEDEVKLMAVYCSKYGALRIGDTTTLVISPEAGEHLINTFLKLL